MPVQSVLNLIMQPCWSCLTVIDTQIYHFLISSQLSRKLKTALCRTVFKWMSKLTTPLQFPRLVIGLKISRQFFNQWEAKPIAPCTREFSRASGELQVIVRNCDWFIALFVPVVIGRSSCFGFGFSTVTWKPLNINLLESNSSCFTSPQTGHHKFLNEKLELRWFPHNIRAMMLSLIHIWRCRRS